MSSRDVVGAHADANHARLSRSIASEVLASASGPGPMSVISQEPHHVRLRAEAAVSYADPAFVAENRRHQRVMHCPELKAMTPTRSAPARIGSVRRWCTRGKRAQPLERVRGQRGSRVARCRPCPHPSASAPPPPSRRRRRRSDCRLLHDPAALPSARRRASRSRPCRRPGIRARRCRNVSRRPISAPVPNGAYILWAEIAT